MNMYRYAGLLIVHHGGYSWRWWDTYERAWQFSMWDNPFPPSTAVLIAKNVVFK